jgi:hypothetical protein
VSGKKEELLKKLDILTEKMDILIKVAAIGTQRETLFKNMKQKQQIEMLAKMGLPRNIVALMVGTTPLTVSVTLSRMKTKKPKPAAMLRPTEENAEQ